MSNLIDGETKLLLINNGKTTYQFSKRNELNQILSLINNKNLQEKLNGRYLSDLSPGDILILRNRTFLLIIFLDGKCSKIH